MKWEKKSKLDHAKLDNGIVLRISYQHLPFSYGTESNLMLQMMTPKGWENVFVRKWKHPDDPRPNWDQDEPNKTRQQHEEAVKEAKEYAEYVFSHYQPPKEDQQ